jgi:hypothetical protein
MAKVSGIDKGLKPLGAEQGDEKVGAERKRDGKTDQWFHGAFSNFCLSIVASESRFTLFGIAL